MTLKAKAIPSNPRRDRAMIEGIEKAIALHQEYFECCAYLITEFPQLTHIVRDGRALINEERRQLMIKQEKEEWAAD